MANFYYVERLGNRYPYPGDRTIKKVFTKEYDYDFYFDSYIGLWTDQMTFFMTEDELALYIGSGLKNEKAMEYYEKKCEEMYMDNKDLFDQLKEPQQ